MEEIIAVERPGRRRTQVWKTGRLQNAGLTAHVLCDLGQVVPCLWSLSFQGGSMRADDPHSKGFCVSQKSGSRPANVDLLSLLPCSGESHRLFISRTYRTFTLPLYATSFIRAPSAPATFSTVPQGLLVPSAILRSVAGEIFIEHVSGDITPARTLQQFPLGLKEAPKFSLLPPQRPCGLTLSAYPPQSTLHPASQSLLPLPVTPLPIQSWLTSTSVSNPHPKANSSGSFL